MPHQMPSNAMGTREPLIRLLTVMETMGHEAPSRLRSALDADAARAELRTLTQSLDAQEMLRLLEGIANAGLANGRDIIESIIDAGPEDAIGPGATLQRLHKAVVISRTFRAERIQALQHACRIFADEPAS